MITKIIESESTLTQYNFYLHHKFDLYENYNAYETQKIHVSTSSHTLNGIVTSVYQCFSPQRTIKLQL